MSGASCSSGLVSLRRSASPWPPSWVARRGGSCSWGARQESERRRLCACFARSTADLRGSCRAPATLCSRRARSGRCSTSPRSQAGARGVGRERRQAARGRGGAHGRAASAGADDPGYRGPALGGRGHARRREAARSQDRGGSRSGSRQLPRRRARPRPPASARARRVRERPGGRAAQARALSPAAVAKLAEPHGVDADELYRKTEGNPFFVTEVLAAGEGEIPDTVRDAVLARAARLSPAARTLLEAAAVVPPPVELWLLETLAADVVDQLDECLTSGMLTAAPAGVAFRHELARLAVEESLAPNRRVALHQKALAALADPPGGAPELARLAHHAEAAGDGEAVLEFAPAAAARAASLGAHREAAAQYARALRFAEEQPLEARAELLKRRSCECYLTDQADEATEAQKGAIECYRRLGDRRREGDTLRLLSSTSLVSRSSSRGGASRPGGRGTARAASARTRARDGIQHRVAALRSRRGRRRSPGLGHPCDRTRAAPRRYRGPQPRPDQHRRAGVPGRGARGSRRSWSGASSSPSRQGSTSTSRMPTNSSPGSPFTSGRTRSWTVTSRPGSSNATSTASICMRLYLLAYRARAELDQGRWSEAVGSAALVLHERCISTTPRTLAFVVLGLVRARRGDPEVWPPLDEALALAEPTGELPRIAPVAAARAEAAWLEGEHEAVAEATEAALDFAVQRQCLVGDWRARLLALAGWDPGGDSSLTRPSRMPSRCGASGRGPQHSGPRSAAPMRPPWRWLTQTTTMPCATR